VCDAPRAGRGQISLSFNSDGVLVEAPLLVQRARARDARERGERGCIE
jgi:hypothetical protein